MNNNIRIVLFLTFFGTNSVFGLKCRCSKGSPLCSSDGVCTVDKGVCAITQTTGFGIQQQCLAQAGGLTTGCIKTDAGGITIIQCTCNDKELCNEKISQTDFGTRPSKTIKCRCAKGQNGCDSSSSCSTVGICIRVQQAGTFVQQCSDAGGQIQIGCTKTKFNNGTEANQCGCEDKDYCNKSAGKQYIQSLLFVLLSFVFLFNRF